MSPRRLPPHVCFVVETYLPRTNPTELELSAVAERLAELGARPVVATLRRPADLPAAETINGVEVVRLAPGANRWRALRPFYSWLRANAHRFDLLYVSPFRTLAIPVMLARKNSRQPVVLRPRHEEELSGGFFEEGLRRLHLSHRSLVFRSADRFRRLLLLKADHFIPATAHVDREFRELRVRADRRTLLPTMIDRERFRPASAAERLDLRAAFGLPSNGFIVCYAGSLRRSMGATVLLDAWQRVPADEQSLLLMVGYGGTPGDYALAEVERRCLEERYPNPVRFIEATGDLSSYMRSADAFVMTPEGVNSSYADWIAEAMACGLPTITSPVHGMEDFVRHGVNALTVPPADPNAIAASIVRLRTDASLALQLGTRAASDMDARSSAVLVPRYLELFERLTGWPKDDPEPGLSPAPAEAVLT